MVFFLFSHTPHHHHTHSPSLTLYPSVHANLGSLTPNVSSNAARATAFSYKLVRSKTGAVKASAKVADKTEI